MQQAQSGTPKMKLAATSPFWPDSRVTIACEFLILLMLLISSISKRPTLNVSTSNAQ
jgi:hypothetical protein